MKMIVFEANFVFYVFAGKEKTFHLLPFTGIFVHLNADKIPGFFFIFQLKYQ